jgi:hypothetical protein
LVIILDSNPQKPKHSEKSGTGGDNNMNELQMVFAFASIFFGVLLRTLLPSLSKLQGGQQWDHTYTATAFFAIVTSFVTATLAFPTFSLPLDIGGLFGIFVVSFVFGWGLNDFYNKIFADFQTITAILPKSTQQIMQASSTTEGSSNSSSQTTQPQR